MKKALLCLVFAFCTAVGANAYAEGTVTYNDTNDIATPSGTTGNIEIVIITDSATFSGITGNNIFYIDQTPSGSPLDAAAGFAMKKDAPNGTYYMRLRYEDLSSETIEFTVANNIKSSDVAMTNLPNSYLDENNQSDSTAFITNDLIKPSEYNIIKFELTSGNTKKYLGYPLSGLKTTPISLGDDNVFLGVQLYNISSLNMENALVSAWLSKDTMATNTPTEGGDS